MNKFLMLSCWLFCGFAHAQTADEIINKYIDATGGHDKWAHVNTLKFTGTYNMGPGMEAPTSRIITSKPTIAYYGDFSWQGMTAKSAMRADSGWKYMPFSGKRETDPMSANEIRNTRLDADPQGLLFNYKEKGYTADYLGTDDMDGSDVYKIRLTTRDGDMVYYYIDMETYYILKIAERVRFKDKEEKSYTVYSDYKKTDYGIIMAYATQQVDEHGNEQGGPVTYTKIEVNPVVDYSIFDKTKK